MRVALVAKPDQHMTGLRRYAESLYGPLIERNVDASLVYPRVPRALERIGRALGLDAAAFFSSFPLAAPVGGYDLCHLASQTLSTLLLFQRLPRTVVTVHDLFPHLVRHDPSLTTYRNRLERGFDELSLRALRRADRLIAISDYTKSCIIQALNYPEERIHVIHRAVDTAVFRPQPVPAVFRQKYGLPEKSPYILYVGSEDPRKNVATLLRAFAHVQQQVPNAVLLKAGAAHFGPERQKLLRLAADLGLLAAVRFLDQVPDDDLPLLYNAATVFVLPSFYEGFGLPALEAMSCGTPVLAADRTSLPEVVGDAGLLFDPEDETALAAHLLALLTDAQRRAAASAAALHQAMRFSLQRQATETLSVYQQLE
ncbi:MAG: glycosyltransferase family 4 protein [Chloroflexi bacterium]|nr:glycosyltransferase family 4 protein [Chloroflexota bacterium]